MLIEVVAGVLFVNMLTVGFICALLRLKHNERDWPALAGVLFCALSVVPISLAVADSPQ